MTAATSARLGCCANQRHPKGFSMGMTKASLLPWVQPLSIPISFNPHPDGLRLFESQEPACSG